MNINFSRLVNAPVAKVFDVYSDFGRAAARVKGIQNLEILTDQPVGVGTRFRETRLMFGRETTEEMEVTEFEPNNMYAVEAFSCGAHFRTVY